MVNGCIIIWWKKFSKIKIDKKRPEWVVFLFLWESACINRAENKQEFTDLMQQVKEFKDKWLNI